MSFNIWPAFSFNLNRIIVSSVKFGKYDGIHVCLTAVTSTDKVILHNPYKKLNTTNNRLSWSETSSDIAILNFNQEIRAIETGCLSTTDSKEILVIGSPTQLLAYHVDNNRDIFFKEIMEGILSVIIGNVSTFDKPLVVVGGNQYIRGYDIDGNEKLWIITSGNVNTLALIDINGNGKNEIVCGCDNGTIKVYQNDTLLLELFENSNVVQIGKIESSNLFAYTLNDGTIGVYNEGVRLWRIKSKSIGTSMSCFDLLGTGSSQLIIGWESGKVDIRDIVTGESLFKLMLNQMIMSVTQADYRGRGTNDLIICTKNGEVKGYERSKINLQTIKRFDQSELTTLMTIKKNLMTEMSHYQANAKINKENFENDGMSLVPDDVGVIPASTRLQIAISTNTEDANNLHIELSVSTNNETIIKALIIFSEGIFKGETLIGYPYTRPTSRIVLPFRTPKTIPYDIHFKILIGFEHSKQFHVFELTRQLPKFAMYAITNDFDPERTYSEPIQLGEDASYVSFKLNERVHRLCLWINQNFLLPTDIEPQNLERTEELRLTLVSLYDKSPVTLWFYNKDQVKIITQNMELAGSLIHSLTTFLNIEHLMTTASFPAIAEKLTQCYERIEGYETTYTNLILDSAHKKFIAKNLLIQAEDARLYNEKDLARIYTNLSKLNEDLASSYKIRKQNFIEMQKSLDAVNSVLKSSIKLRVGKFAAKMMPLFKVAVKNKNVKAIVRIIESGEN